MIDDWLVWQLADSAFPAGGFAHSGGLEAAWQRGEVVGGAGVEQFLRAALRQAARGAVPLAAAACESPGRLAELDALSEALLTNHVANRASRAQGQALLMAAGRVFPGGALAALADGVRRDRLAGHFAPAFGAIAGALGLAAPKAARLFVFVTLRGLVSAAVRLGAVGPLEAQGIQARLAPAAEEAAGVGVRTAAEDASQTAPLLDIFHATHDRLYSRLFVS